MKTYHVHYPTDSWMGQAHIALYVERCYTPLVHAYISSHLSQIQTLYRKSQIDFVYLPESLSNLPDDVCRYLTGQSRHTLARRLSGRPSPFSLPPSVSSQITGAAILFLNGDSGQADVYPLCQTDTLRSTLRLQPLQIFEDILTAHLLTLPRKYSTDDDSICFSRISEPAVDDDLLFRTSERAINAPVSRPLSPNRNAKSARPDCVRYSLKPAPDPRHDGVLKDFDSLDANAQDDILLRKMSRLFDELTLRRGYTVDGLLQLLTAQQTISPIRITAGHDIILTAYEGLTIHFPPVLKAIYLLFLRHPEGISFKAMTDHRDELLSLYRQVAQRGTDAKLIATVDDLVNPLSNAMNEKCSRIKNIFHFYLAPTLAEHYCITGDKGEKKRIPIDPKLIQWE